MLPIEVKKLYGSFPHREPMLWVDHITFADETKGHGRFNLREEGLYFTQDLRGQSEPHRIHLAVQDDGKGFEPRQRGLGLLGMEERVTHLGGEFQVESTPGHGTILNVVLPLAS